MLVSCERETWKQGLLVSGGKEDFYLLLFILLSVNLVNVLKKKVFKLCKMHIP